MILLIIVLLLVLLLIPCCCKHTKLYECFSSTNNNIEFIDKETLKQILINDEDNYYKHFFVNDYKVRNINNISEYNNHIISSVAELNNAEKNKVIQCCKDITVKYVWFDNVKFNNIVWKIGAVSGTLYENGLSHTRNDVIVISKEYINNSSLVELTRTLLHEKVHIYQKMYPEDVDKFLDSYKFTKFKIREARDNTRANPDIDDWIYKDENGMIYKAEYKPNPKNLSDTNTPNQMYEHPYEKMAILISN